MRTDVKDDGASVVVSVDGRLDAASAASFDEAVEALPRLEPPRRILVDLAPLEFISSAGLRCLLNLGKACKASGAALAFCSLNPMVADVFKISGFHAIFKVFPGRGEALAEWGAGPAEGGPPGGAPS